VWAGLASNTVLRVNARVGGEVVERDMATRRVAGRGKAGGHIKRVLMARSKAELDRTHDERDSREAGGLSPAFNPLLLCRTLTIPLP
jgi:hypothetical protein